MEIEYVLFDNINTYIDFGLLIQSIFISEAPIKEEKLDIPRNRWNIRFFKFINWRN